MRFKKLRKVSLLASATTKRKFCERAKYMSALPISHANTIPPSRTAIAANANVAPYGVFAWMQ